MINFSHYLPTRFVFGRGVEDQTGEQVRALGATKKALVLVAEKDETLLRASRNIPGVTIALVNTINVYEILRHDAFILTQDAVRQVEEVYA